MIETEKAHSAQRLADQQTRHEKIISGLRTLLSEAGHPQQHQRASRPATPKTGDRRAVPRVHGFRAPQLLTQRHQYLTVSSCRISLYGIKSAGCAGAGVDWLALFPHLPGRSGSACCARPGGRARAGRPGGQR
jgi:hypothetical protein